MIANELIGIFRRQRLVFFSVLFCGFALTVLVVLFAPRRYQSRAKLLMRLGRENVSLDPTITTTGETASLYRTGDSEVNTALQTMTSQGVFEKVIDDVGASAILRGSLDPSKKSGGVWSNTKRYVKSLAASIDPIDDRERALLELQDGVKIDAERESRVVNIAYQTKTPELAQRVAQSWTGAYLAAHSKMHTTKGSLEFFESQEAELLARLQESRETLQARKSKYGLVTISGQQGILEQQIQWAKSSLIQGQAKLAATRARLASLQQQRASTSEMIVTSEATTDTNAARERMRDRLFALEIEERDLSTRYSREHPVYEAALQQLNEARRVFDSQRNAASEVVEGMNPLHIWMLEQLSSESANLQALEAEVKSNRDLMDQLTDDLRALNSHEAELAALERTVEVLETQFRGHFIKREQARLAAELESQQVGSINIIQSATLERRPSSPNKKLCALLGFLGSIAAAIGAATLREANTQMAGNKPQPSEFNGAGQEQVTETLPANEFVSVVSVR